MCNSEVKISCDGRSDIKVKLDTTKHSDNFCIINHIIFFCFIFNDVCFKHVLKIHYKNCLVFKIDMLPGINKPFFYLVFCREFDYITIDCKLFVILKKIIKCVSFCLILDCLFIIYIYSTIKSR